MSYPPFYGATNFSMKIPTFLWSYPPFYGVWVKSRCILNDWLLRYEYRQRKEKTCTYNPASSSPKPQHLTTTLKGSPHTTWSLALSYASGTTSSCLSMSQKVLTSGYTPRQAAPLPMNSSRPLYAKTPPTCP